MLSHRGEDDKQEWEPSDGVPVGDRAKQEPLGPPRGIGAGRGHVVDQGKEHHAQPRATEELGADEDVVLQGTEPWGQATEAFGQKRERGRGSDFARRSDDSPPSFR